MTVIPFIAALALSLFAVAWSPAATAASPCDTLTSRLLLYMQGRIEENPTKPKNVAAAVISASSISVSWDVPSNRPAATVTGWCVNFTHRDSGETDDDCQENSRTVMTTSCPTERYCTGTFDLWVRLQNNCGLTETVSDSISILK